MVETPEPSLIHFIVHFFRTLDWSEPFLRVLCGFHAANLLFFICTLGAPNLQFIVALLYCIVLSFIRYINRWCSAHWQMFFRHTNQFDENGAFIALMFGFPVLVMLVFVLINWVRIAGKLLIQLGRAKQLQKKFREQQLKHQQEGTAEGEEAPSGTTSTSAAKPARRARRRSTERTKEEPATHHSEDEDQDVIEIEEDPEKAKLFSGPRDVEHLTDPEDIAKRAREMAVHSIRQRLAAEVGRVADRQEQRINKKKQ
eukprot:gnl/Trimastix_PCT/3231.p1 GENE.gnl/Trimastix_PCT/3231~~gnl/Trimastix_PCT/3231.p1  ORF type:complete len:256 (-),score=42.32 gnl/Trimastix_PCT/3231:35-802(-)